MIWQLSVEIFSCPLFENLSNLYCTNFCLSIIRELIASEASFLVSSMARIFYIIVSVDSTSRDEPDSPLTQYITNAGISRARYTITHIKHHHRVPRLISNQISKFTYAPREVKTRDLAFFFFFLILLLARLHVNPLHFLARSAVC